MEFPQSTIDQILDSEKEMVRAGSRRYGEYANTALEFSMLMGQFIESIDPYMIVFGSFLSLVKKYHTLALISTLRLHEVQAMMNLRQMLEAGACAAFAVANPEFAHFVVADEHNTLARVRPQKRYAWIDQNYPEVSTFMKQMKAQINATVAHADFIITHKTFQLEAGRISTSFFDIEDEHSVKTDLCTINTVANMLMSFFYMINEGRNVIRFVDNLWTLIQSLLEKNISLRDELMSTDRFKSTDTALHAGTSDNRIEHRFVDKFLMLIQSLIEKSISLGDELISTELRTALQAIGAPDRIEQLDHTISILARHFHPRSVP